MPYSAASLSSDETTALAADKTLIGANGATVPGVSATIEWRNGGSWAAGSDETETGYETSFSIDGFTDQPTRADTARATNYLLFDFGASGIEFDFVAVLNVTDALDQIDVEIADDNAYTSNKLTLATWSSTTAGARQIDLTLNGGNNRYSTVRYARLKFQLAGTSKYEIGEVIFGRRRQLQQNPDRPYSPDLLASEGVRVRALGGPVASYTFNRGRRLINATTRLIGTTEQSDVTSWWDDIGQGKEPFVWIDEPSSAPGSFYFALFDEDDPSLHLEDRGPSHWAWTVQAVEQGPDYLKLES